VVLCIFFKSVSRPTGFPFAYPSSILCLVITINNIDTQRLSTAA
jgi:hypothetical protein